MSCTDPKSACAVSSGEPLGTTSGAALLCNTSAIDKVVNGDAVVSTRTNKKLSSLSILEANYAPTAINGGVWDSGKVFTAYNQYMVYSGTAYQVKSSVALPYVSKATPDLANVVPVNVNAGVGLPINAVIYLNAVDNVYISTDGSVWLRSGFTSTELLTYPFATITNGKVGLATAYTDPVTGLPAYTRVK